MISVVRIALCDGKQARGGMVPIRLVNASKYDVLWHWPDLSYPSLARDKWLPKVLVKIQILLLFWCFSFYVRDMCSKYLSSDMNVGNHKPVLQVCLAKK